MTVFRRSARSSVGGMDHAGQCGDERPRPDDRPPEEQRAREERHVFHAVPERHLQRELVRARQVPAPHRDGHDRKTDAGVRQAVRAASQRRPGEERAERVANEPARQSTQQGHDWGAQQDQRRRHGHEHQMLRHVGRQKQARERIEGRGSRQPERRQAGGEADETPSRKQGVMQVPQPAPSSKVDDARQHEDRRWQDVDAPGSEDRERDRGCVHGSGLWRLRAGARCDRWRRRFSDCRAPERCSAGCSVSRNVTSAVTSRGIEVLAVRRHVAPSLDHLPNQLIPREPDRHFVERRPTGAAFGSERMTVPALLEPGTPPLPAAPARSVP